MHRRLCASRLRILHIHLIIFDLDTRYAYSEEADSCDDTPVLGACEALDGALREAGLRNGATLSIQLLGWHDVVLDSLGVLSVRFTSMERHQSDIPDYL